MRSIFDTTRLKQTTLKNRIVRSATWEQMATDDGRMTDRLFDVYDKLAQGGVGLIITSYTHITEAHRPNRKMLGIDDDRGLPGYRALTKNVHRHGCAIVMQIVYGGTQSFLQPEDGSILGPSAVAEMSSGVIAKEMTHADIQTLIKAFRDAAVRAQKAGFDGVQIHCAHGYGLGQWISPYHNRRQDDYGGSKENRSRIIIETYQAIRRSCGENFLIMIKINSEDFVIDGATFEDCRYVCGELSRRGVDAIEISGGVFAAEEDQRWARPGINTPEKEGYFSSYAAEIAEEVTAPVILVGGLKSIDVIEKLLAETKIAYFSMARALMAETDLVLRWQQGDRQTSRCISCNDCRHPDGNICILHRYKDSGKEAP